MAEQSHEATAGRRRLSRERVLHGALAMADAHGLQSLTIRSLAAELGTKPMSVYYHVANKEEILNGLVDLVFGEIDLPTPGHPWRTEMTRRAESARAVLRRHRWAIGLLDSRTSPGPATLRHHDAILGTFRAAGFSPARTAHGVALLDSYVYGFALQEASLPFEGPESLDEIAGPIIELMATGEYPNLMEMTTTFYLQPGYAFADEFRFGLDLILDGLEQSFVVR